ncbi:hypothetical protein TTHERM_00301810 (macronuclear) [Tetrahymena thermophila SB210]|uniref:Uncharacterized protein n=1 Tax=Tetrahymena thermophila (strain SB210) TaxID=312017 RepID=I7MAD3_TETTS|nr:hypothetical protein TTHERM_00301810 [Tetrahymena thermophila SB210]EAS04364.2 hypothetical protein TTHERM_00301810 [Tetrahymena thermophila SB210]|eukprot:XP_001024609.2 hypothetical protein TTHERM_00301810 [Tetrahymena thermophila SB210]
MKSQMNAPQNQENKEKEEINNYDEFKQIKRSGIQRRQKLSQIKQSGLPNSIAYQSQVLMNYQKENEQKEEKLIMNQQQNSAKNKSQLESVFQIDNAPVNFETIQQELLNISATNKSSTITERKFKQPGIIILDKQLLDKATPLIQQYVGINLETSDPTLNEQVQKQIKQYQESLDEQLQLSENIYSKVKKNDQIQNRNNSFLNQKQDDALVNKSNENKYQEQSETQNNSSSLITPYQNFFSRQEEDIRQKLMDKFLEKNSVKQPEREQDMNFYQDILEDQKQDTKRKADPLAKNFDFFQLNQNKSQKQNQVVNKWKPIKNFNNQDSQIDQFIQSDYSEAFIDKIKDLPDQMMKEEDQNIFIPTTAFKNNIDGLLLPQMYQGNSLKLPKQLQKDHYETFLGGRINYSSPQQKLQNEMIFNQISPLAREAARNISYSIEDQFVSGNKQHNFVTPKPKNLILLSEDPQFSPEEINFETILNIVGDGISPDQLSKLAAQQEASTIKKEGQNNFQQNDTTQYGTQVKNNTSIEIANFKNVLHQSNQNITNQNTNNLNYSLSSRNNQTNYYDEQHIQDISNNPTYQNGRNQIQKEKTEKQMSDQSVQYDPSINDINYNQTNGSNNKYSEILDQEITDFKIENLKQQKQQQQQQQLQQIQPQQQYTQQQQQNLNQNKRPSINSDHSQEVQKMEIQQVLNDIKQLQNQRKNTNLSQIEHENLVVILKGRLNDLIEFVKYDNEGNDIFGDVTTQEFFDDFPQNVEKIKYQTVCGFQKLRLLYTYFENFLPLLEENMSQQYDHHQSKSSPEVLMNNDYSSQAQNKTIPKTNRNVNQQNRNVNQQNRNENNYQNQSRSPYNKNNNNQTLSPNNRFQNNQQQNRVLAGKPKQNQVNQLQLQTTKQQFNKEQRNAELAMQMKTARSNNGLDKTTISNNNKSYSINQTTQMYSPVSKQSSQSIKYKAGSFSNKTFTNIQSPSNSYLAKKNVTPNKNLSSNNINRNLKNTTNTQQQNRSLSNKKTQGYLNSARTATNLKQNRQEGVQQQKRQTKLNKSEDFSQRQFFNNNLNNNNNYNNNNYDQNFDYQDNYGNQFMYNQQQKMMMMNNHFNNYDNYSYEEN